ncbi:MAG: leucine-rich repeat domain-containing protein [Saccharofermentanales bacterium]
MRRVKIPIVILLPAMLLLTISCDFNRITSSQPLSSISDLQFNNASQSSSVISSSKIASSDVESLPPGAIAFKDANFEIAVRELLNKLKGAVFPEELDGITEFKLMYQVLEITDLKWMPHLQKLDIRDTYIGESGTYLDIGILSQLKNLVELDVFNSCLKDISPLAGLHDLKILDLSGNPDIIDFDPISELTSLKTLYIFMNNFTNLNFLVKLVNLEEIGFGPSNIGNISTFRYLKKLKTISIDSNEISDLSPLKDLTELRDIRCQQNQVKSLAPLASLQNLNILDLGNNPITDFSGLENLKNLDYLSLNYCNIKDASALSSLTGLTNLQLYHNEISDIGFVRGMTQLETLELLENEIIDISPLKDLKNLQILGLGKNRIENIEALRGLTGLHELYLFGNPVKDYSPVRGYYDYLDCDFKIND